MPEPTTFDIVQTAMSEAADTAADVAADAVETPAEVVADPDPAVVADLAAEAVVETPAADDPDKEWTDLGLTAPKPGQRENRLPHTRVRKMIETERKKLADAHATAIKEHQNKLTKAEEKAAHMDAWDRMISENADESLRRLAIINPEFQRYLTPKEAAKEAAKVEERQAEPRPAPDATFADGSKGYSAEGLDRLLAWQEQQAVDKATKQFNERLLPIEAERKVREAKELQQKTADAYRAQQIPIIKNQIAFAEKTWGTLFTDDYNRQHEDKSEILHAMRANPNMPFDSVVAQVLLPKLQAKLDSQRADIIKEINGRPAAAVKTPVAAVLAGADDTAPQKTEDIVRAQMRAAGLK